MNGIDENGNFAVPQPNLFQAQQLAPAVAAPRAPAGGRLRNTKRHKKSKRTRRHKKSKRYRKSRR